MDTKKVLTVGLAVLGAATMPSMAAQESIKGTFALPGESERAVGALIVKETGPLTRELSIAFTDKATGQPIVQFDEELTQRLHVLATDSRFTSFIHEHAAKLGADGRFKVAMKFPRPGTYYVYADAVPSGLGQQVVRFEVPVQGGTDAAAHAPAEQKQGSDGPYTVKLDTSALRAGSESMMSLTVLKDGKPAQDLDTYLGVAAHAVFVSTDELDYVHAHAMAAPMPGQAPHGGHGGHGDAGAVSAQLMLHAKPAHAGPYALWIQFKGGDTIRTVPFRVTVPAAS
ncbi:hypothetical protein C4K00_2419 [Pseudomonas synxantha]|uniref:hypothetical protein n=1 Tax=Pseudomonas synxantha TaxID=47883 RepID=UPI000F55AEA8|nr:hypothetical protein [Pseudomonas synxantha]AZE72648.1 hypothetical protein C4K00_2419 [Pseudomonas synxantha]